MKTIENTIIVFTAKNFDETIKQGGSGNWKLNIERAKKCSYIILTANKHHKESASHTVEHGQAFIIGKISGFSSDAYDDQGHKEDDRWIVQFNEYAEINTSNIVWGGFQNPVRYVDISEFDVNLDSLEWKPFPFEESEDQAEKNIPELTIKEAKKGIAKKLGIHPDCIEITIRA